MGVNKATGVKTVLEELGLSAHNLVAIGDAENDLDLFELAEHAVAVGNADRRSSALPIVSHALLMPKASSSSRRELLDNDLASAPVRRRIVLGIAAGQHEVTLPPARVLGTVERARLERQSSTLQQRAESISGTALSVLCDRCIPARASAGCDGALDVR